MSFKALLFASCLTSGLWRPEGLRPIALVSQCEQAPLIGGTQPRPSRSQSPLYFSCSTGKEGEGTDSHRSVLSSLPLNRVQQNRRKRRAEAPVGYQSSQSCGEDWLAKWNLNLGLSDFHGHACQLCATSRALHMAPLPSQKGIPSHMRQS